MVRNWHRPQWHFRLTLAGLTGAVAAALYLGRPEPPPPPPPPPEPVEAAPEAPADTASFPTRLLAEVDSVLSDLGIPPGHVDRREAGGGVPDVVTVRVPGDLPLASVNLQLTRLADRHGGEVMRGQELEDETDVDLSVGIDSVVTTRFRLRQNRGSTRRAGRIALVADASGPHLDRLCALPPSLTLVVLGSRRREVAERCGPAGHRVVSKPVGLRAAPDSIGGDTEAAGRQLWALAERAAVEGEAVAVVRADGPTLAALEALLPRLESRGYRLVSVSEIGR